MVGSCKGEALASLPIIRFNRRNRRARRRDRWRLALIVTGQALALLGAFVALVWLLFIIQYSGGRP